MDHFPIWSSNCHCGSVEGPLEPYPTSDLHRDKGVISAHLGLSAQPFRAVLDANVKKEMNLTLAITGATGAILARGTLELAKAN